MISGSMRTTSPTRPTSIFFFLSSLLATLSLRAWMKCPSLPVSPTALPPALLMSVTISWLMRPPSTISTTSSVSSSVTRMPWMNSLCLPSFCRSAPICGPAPCTTTGFIPMSFSSTMSSAKSSCSAASVIALPPYLITRVLL